MADRPQRRPSDPAPLSRGESLWSHGTSRRPKADGWAARGARAPAASLPGRAGHGHGSWVRQSARCAQLGTAADPIAVGATREGSSNRCEAGRRGVTMLALSWSSARRPDPRSGRHVVRCGPRAHVGDPKHGTCRRPVDPFGHRPRSLIDGCRRDRRPMINGAAPVSVAGCGEDADRTPKDRRTSSCAAASRPRPVPAPGCRWARR